MTSSRRCEELIFRWRPVGCTDRRLHDNFGVYVKQEKRASLEMNPIAS